MGAKVRIEKSIDKHALKTHLTDFPGGGALIEASLREANIRLDMQVTELRKHLSRMEEWKAGVNASIRSRRVDIAAALLAAHVGKTGLLSDDATTQAVRDAVYGADCLLDELLSQARTPSEEQDLPNLEAEGEQIANDIAALLGEENL